MSAVAHLRPVAEHLLTKQQLAQHLGRSTRWIEMRVREGMPSQEPTKRYPMRRFRLGDVENWLANGTPKPSTPQTVRLADLEQRVAQLQATVEQLERRLG